MIDDFDRFTRSVTEYLTEHNRRESTIRVYDDCFRKLREFLLDRDLSYSPDVAAEWLGTQKGHVSKTRFDLYKTAVNKLNDLYHHGDIRGYHCDPSHAMCARLNPEFSQIRKGFAEWLTGRADVTVYNETKSCTKILLDFQSSGVSSVSEMTYDALAEELSLMGERPYTSRTADHSVLRQLIAYLYELGLVPYGYILLVDCVTKSTRYVPVMMPEDKRLALVKTTAGEKTLSFEEYKRLCDGICAEHENEKYSTSAVHALHTGMTRFYLFMDMNGLRYSPACGDAWLGSIEPHLCTAEYMDYRRTASLIKERFNGTGLRLGSSFVFKETVLSRLPSWCREEVESFLTVKKNEGWAHNTLDMYRASICRFCESLNKAGTHDFASLTPEDIKRFNATDVHSTPEGKNAYNSRIRKFLDYLGDTGKLTNRYLYMALPSVCARREHIVTVLTEDEQKRVSEALSEKNTEIPLRDKAMVSLGLHMGLRKSDVVGLTIDDIDWDACTMRVLQDKTDKEILLPMPTQVANALFRYITRERPVSPERIIFLRSKAPYCPVGTYACDKALEHMLPGRDIYGSGFHVLRKTYATNLLRNDAGVQEVAEALGHSDLSTVDKYLSLDEKRMKECAFSLEEKGIAYEGGF